jgi:uncharacterized membrane protein YphA (DoxX/SURF4 family)
MKSQILKYLFNISRILLGIIFIYSGFVKGIDLTGSAIKFGEYFGSVGLPEMPQLSLILAFLMCGAEFLIGIGLLTGIFINLTAWTTVFFLGFFLILTFFLALFNPVSDCGCFGDAIKLTNWETFFKNVIFAVPAAFIFIRRKQFNFYAPLWFEWAVLIITICMYSFISIYSYRHLPIIDFMPYSIGSNIQEKMTIPPDKPRDQYETMLYYKNLKTGEVKEFTADNIPWQDSLTWKWVDTKVKLIKKGFEPEIHGFSITDSTGTDITDIVLADTGYSFIFISKNLDEVKPKEFYMAKKIAGNCDSLGNCKFYVLTSSTSGAIQKAKKNYGLNFNFCTGDETTMKSIVRANPGMILLKSGNIIGKWHYNDMSKITDIKNGKYVSTSLTNLRKSSERGNTWIFMLSIAFAFSFLWALSLYCKKQNTD